MPLPIYFPGRLENAYAGACETSPPVALAILRQLVILWYEQQNILIGDPISILQANYDAWHAEFPDIKLSTSPPISEERLSIRVIRPQSDIPTWVRQCRMLYQIALQRDDGSGLHDQYCQSEATSSRRGYVVRQKPFWFPDTQRCQSPASFIGMSSGGRKSHQCGI